LRPSGVTAPDSRRGLELQALHPTTAPEIRHA
jgi:hypothetical protein